jgi:hypothetical protein
MTAPDVGLVRWKAGYQNQRMFHRSTPAKAAVILYGLLAGLASVVVVTIGSFFVASFASPLLRYTPWDQSGELSAWFGIIAGYYGLFPGILVGIYVCWKVCKSRLAVLAK